MKSAPPRVIRGALASLNKNRLVDIVSFQYNPESITRTLTPQMAGQDSADPEPRYIDAPAQTINFTAYLDATDALAAGDQTTLTRGLTPQLALLETLIYPSRQSIEDRDDQTGGQLNVAAPVAPRTILIWGQQRVLPVRVTSLAITEEAFDAGLNPIQASAAITVEVQTYGDRTSDDADYLRFAAYHETLENAASIAAGPSTAERRRLQSLLQS
jgi:hypothetical protein